uniref:Uncharacterized protein n=1 Tax=Salix viminalis TaxID=40686 RepID=A0A6N2MWV4_SALVM
MPSWTFHKEHIQEQELIILQTNMLWCGCTAVPVKSLGISALYNLIGNGTEDIRIGIDKELNASGLDSDRRE